ncbi:ABC transporter B family member 21 [Hibiscus syriacus]|uniref:ABC transporter B family member 21 n=1 Tax=Hibiscus syriacus TaxID=106335 RepID=A0A6A3CFQ0_HIBSY|nr:ABC transporter B family member 21 [Hibiscus syriacus]
MASENGLNEPTARHEASTSKSQEEPEKISGVNGKNQGSEGKKGDGKTNTVAFYKLFAFADLTDILLMIVGTIGAVGNGVCMPLMTVLLGDLIDAFGENQNDDRIVDTVSRVALRFVYLGAGALVAAFLQVACWIVTGERQASRIRGLYLKTILRQDVAFFDFETNTGEVVGRMSGDTVLIQDAMGEKLIPTFIGGFVIAFVRGWLLTLVMLSSIPPLVISVGAMALIISKMASLGQNAYAKAATVVEQTIGSIRTVASFTGEKQAISNYNKFLVTAYKSGVHGGTAAGLGLGVLFLIVFCSYSLAIWFGARMVLERGYSGGEVITVIFAVPGAGIPIRDCICFGQAAAFKMFESIKRKPIIDPYDTRGKVSEDIHGDVELRDVYFSYPARPDEQIFSGFSLSIQNGTTAALVGQSGSGNSTVISLIESFMILMMVKFLLMALISRSFSFDGSGERLVLLARSLYCSHQALGITLLMERKVQPQKRYEPLLNLRMHLSSSINCLRDYILWLESMELSFLVRAAIARAILKDPRILLLDEATSALDAESERIVQEALDRMMRNRTTIIVAHCLITVIEISYGNSESFKHSSPRRSLQRSISRGSSMGNRKRHSFNASFGLSTAMHVTDPTMEDTEKPSEVPSEQAPKVYLRRLAYLNKPEIPVLLLGTIAAAANSVIFPIFGILISRVIDTFFKPPHEIREDSRFWALIFIALGVASVVVGPAQNYFFSMAGCKLVQRIRSMCFEKVVCMEVGWFDELENSSGAIGARLSVDAATIHVLVGDTLAQLIQNSSSAIAGLVIAFVACWQLAIIVLVQLPLVGLNGYIQIKFMKGFSADAKANDAVGSIRTVASFCAEEKVMQLYKKKCEGPMKTGIKQGLISGTGFGVSFFFLFSFYATSFYAGAQLVEHGYTTFRDVFQVFFALTMAAIGISQSSSFAPDSGKAKVAAASIFAIIDRESKIDPSDESGMTLENVTLVADIQILRDLSVSIRAGKTVALVGESGSGKSTVISLLERFYEPESGSITLDGVEIRKFQLKWLRQKMGLVSQEPVLFNGTIRANIAYGKGGNATESEIFAASELANAHKFISALQQKQRVAIERAIVKRPTILLLDEATSVLDAESEKVVQDAPNRVIVNRTTVVVAHRLSTIKNADVIAVVKNGVIVEKGKHDTLINIKDGFYASLVSLHMNGFHA